jgi:hypothetical protein
LVAEQSVRFAGGCGPLGEAEHAGALGMLGATTALVGHTYELDIYPES